MKYFDISPELSTKTAVFPGDTPFSRTVALDFKKGDHLTLSAISTTLHVGAHTDAPNHYHADGGDIASVAIEKYLGLAQVIEVPNHPGARITWKDLNVSELHAPRVLLKTLSFPNLNSWNNDFMSLSPELVHELAAREVCLIGIDTPSVDPADDQTLQSHTAIYSHEMAILEGIDLSKVAAGVYTLIALPLKIRDADASPVRAILVDKDLGLA